MNTDFFINHEGHEHGAADKRKWRGECRGDCPAVAGAIYFFSAFLSGALRLRDYWSFEQLKSAGQFWAGAVGSKLS